MIRFIRAVIKLALLKLAQREMTAAEKSMSEFMAAPESYGMAAAKVTFEYAKLLQAIGDAL